MKILLIVLGVLLLIGGPMAFLMFHGMSEIKRLIIRDVDLSKLADGTYEGSYHKGRWSYDVQVRVQDHRLVSVKNVNRRMDVAKDWNAKAEAALLDKQSLNVDVVSGATVNTKAFEKAVEVALSSPAKR